MDETGLFFDGKDYREFSPRVVSGAVSERQKMGSSRCGGHPYWILDYTMTAGTLYKTVSSRRAWRERPAATGHLYRPETYYWERADEQILPLKSAWIIFAGGEATGLGACIDTRDGLAIFDDPDGVLREALLSFHTTGEGSEMERFLAAQERLFRVLNLLLRAEATGSGHYNLCVNSRKQTAGNLQQRVEAFFLSHLPERLTVADAARHLNMSPSSLSHRYRREAGHSLMEALTIMRVEAVRRQLLLGLTLKEIAPQVGFYDEYHLSKVFKKHVGMSPGRFRRMFRA